MTQSPIVGSRSKAAQGAHQVQFFVGFWGEKIPHCFFFVPLLNDVCEMSNFLADDTNVSCFSDVFKISLNL